MLSNNDADLMEYNGDNQLDIGFRGADLKPRYSGNPIISHPQFWPGSSYIQVGTYPIS